MPGDLAHAPPPPHPLSRRLIGWARGGGRVAKPARTARFPAAGLAALLRSRPFSDAAWEAATSATLYVRIGNDAACAGQGPSLLALRTFLNGCDGFGAGFCEYWAINEAIYIETEIICRLASGAGRRIPCAVIARTSHALVHDLRFYLDPTPMLGARAPDAD